MSARLLAVLVCVSLALGACATDTPVAQPTEVDELSLRIDRLRRQMGEVATAQREATAGLPAVLDAISQLDAFVTGMRDPEQHRATEDTWPRVDGAFAAADPAGLREPLVALAVRVDTARVALARARDALPNEWERAYLDAEDQVLQAVRDYAEETDAFVQIVQRHWPTYTDVHGASSAFVAANEFYRSSQEAVQAYEVRVGRLLSRLKTAQEELLRFRETQTAAARRVNDASRAAVQAWNDRPPSPSPTAS